MLLHLTLQRKRKLLYTDYRGGCVCVCVCVCVCQSVCVESCMLFVLCNLGSCMCLCTDHFKTLYHLQTTHTPDKHTHTPDKHTHTAPEAHTHTPHTHTHTHTAPEAHTPTHTHTHSPYYSP